MSADTPQPAEAGGPSVVNYTWPCACGHGLDRHHPDAQARCRTAGCRCTLYRPAELRRLHISLVLEVPTGTRYSPTDEALMQDLGDLIALGAEVHGATALRGSRVLALGIHRKTTTTPKETPQ